MSAEEAKPSLNVVGTEVQKPMTAKPDSHVKCLNEHDARQNNRITKLETRLEIEFDGDAGFHARLEKSEKFIDELRTWKTRTTPVIIAVTALLTLVIERLISWLQQGR